MKNLRVHIVLFQVVVCLVVCACRPPAATTKNISVNEKDSVHEKIVEKLVPYAVPGDTVSVTEYIECDSVTNLPKPLRGAVRSGRAETSYSIDKNGRLLSKCKCDSLELMVKERDREITRLKRKTVKEIVTVTKTVYKTRNIDWIARIMAVVLIMSIMFKIKKLFL